MAGFKTEKVEKGKNGSCLVVPPDGLDSDGALRIEDRLMGLLREKSINLTVDLRNLSFISAEGMGMLLGIVSSFRSEGGSVVLINVPGKIDARIKMMGADKYFA